MTPEDLTGKDKMKSMTPEQLIEMCDRQIARGYVKVVLIMPGKWGKADTRELCPGGPLGQIVDETVRAGRIFPVMKGSS